MELQSYTPEMQEEMIREIELARPKYLVSAKISTSWLRRRESEPLIFTWTNQRGKRFYGVVGFVNITAERSDYYFGDLPKSTPRLGNYILIYQRKT